MEISLSLKQSLELTFEEYLEELFKLLILKYGKEYNFDILDLRNKFQEYQIVIKKDNTIPKKTDKGNQNQNQNKSKNKKNSKKSKKQKPIDDKSRCCARTWGNAYVDIKKKIYGKRCSNPVKDGNEYCKIHIEHRKHGRYDQEPIDSIKAHYLDHNQKNRLRSIQKSK